MSTTLYGTIRPVGQYDGETRNIEASGDTYELARAALDDQVPDGWQLLGVARWPVTGSAAARPPA